MKGTGSESAAFLSGLVRQNLSVMLKAMRKMQENVPRVYGARIS